MKPKIIQIKCPFCQERYLIAKNKLLHSRSLFQEKEWMCLNCLVWVWPDSWFEQFPQFEHLIKRQGDN